jgi:hypothetical protein
MKKQILTAAALLSLSSCVHRTDQLPECQKVLDEKVSRQVTGCKFVQAMYANRLDVPSAELKHNLLVFDCPRANKYKVFLFLVAKDQQMIVEEVNDG